MTAHRESRIHWRTLFKRIKQHAQGTKSVKWRTVVATFEPEDADRRALKLVRRECDVTLQQLIDQGVVGSCLGMTDSGAGLVVWIEKDPQEKVSNGSEKHTDIESY